MQLTTKKILCIIINLLNALTTSHCVQHDINKTKSIDARRIHSTMNSLVIFLVLVAASTAQVAPNNCSTQYQDALKLILNLKETCRDAIYKDCCEVNFI